MFSDANLKKNLIVSGMTIRVIFQNLVTYLILKVVATCTEKVVKESYKFSNTISANCFFHIRKATCAFSSQVNCYMCWHC